MLKNSVSPILGVLQKYFEFEVFVGEKSECSTKPAYMSAIVSIELKPLLCVWFHHHTLNPIFIENH